MYRYISKIIVFPELCITGYTCGDLFLQETLLEGAKEALKDIAARTRGKDALIFVGLPLEKEGKLYNTAAVLHDGKILAFVPKATIPNYGEFYEVSSTMTRREERRIGNWKGSSPDASATSPTTTKGIKT